MSIKIKVNGENKEEELKKWRASVIRSFYETNKIAEEAMKQGKTAREKLSRELDETKAVANKWNEYSERYKVSIRNFAKRIDDSEQEFKDLNIKLPNSSKEIKHLTDPKAMTHRRQGSACRPTKSSLGKRTKKFINETHFKSFQF